MLQAQDEVIATSHTASLRLPECKDAAMRRRVNHTEALNLVEVGFDFGFYLVFLFLVVKFGLLLFFS